MAYNPQMPSEPLEVESLFGHLGVRGVLRLRGPLTSEYIPDFQNAVRRENVPTMILDLSEVPYIDSAGIGSLVSIYVSRHKLGQRLALSGVNPRVIDLLKITRVEQLFLIFSSLGDAIDGLGNQATA